MDVREKLVELKKVLRECLHFNYDEFSCDMSLDVDLTAENLIAHGVTVQEWISVKDRLPDTECLAVSMLTGPAYEEMLVGYVAEASNWDTGYECESDGEILPNVTHWMPLPQPPKGE
jgi:hypothetical protein